MSLNSASCFFGISCNFLIEVWSDLETEHKVENPYFGLLDKVRNKKACGERNLNKRPDLVLQFILSMGVYMHATGSESLSSNSSAFCASIENRPSKKESP